VAKTGGRVVSQFEIGTAAGTDEVNSPEMAGKAFVAAMIVQ
jgi:hypothetical protein